MQYCEMDSLDLEKDQFEELHTLHLSYNKIPAAHLTQLGLLPNLQVLNIASNNFFTLPSDLSFIQNLQEFNLSSNNFCSDSTLISPSTIFKSLSTLPQLRKLNLSRNKFTKFDSDELPANNADLPQDKQAFPFLEELYIAFNQIESEDALFYPVIQIPSLKYLVITGNPFAMGM